MPLSVGSATLTRVAVIDDDEAVRQAYSYPLEDLGLEAMPEVGPLANIGTLVSALRGRVDAAVCDHHLRVRNYASFDGAELVAGCYQVLPALLCTKWEDASIDDIRQFRGRIPVLLKPSEADPDSIRDGFGRCLAEFAGEFQPNRRPWRALVRVEDVGPEPGRFIFVVVSAWDKDQVVRLRVDHLPIEVRERAAAGTRFHARVNLGAEHHSELYFDGWEPG